MTDEQATSTASPWVWTMPLAPAVMSGFAAFFSAAMTLLMLVFSVWAAKSTGLGVGAFMLAMGVILGLLTLYVARDLRGKVGGRIEIDSGQIWLDLPADRSMMFDTPACKARFPLSEIAEVETRLVSLAGLGSATMQRPFRLLKRDGSDIFLFEDRALGTALSTGYYLNAASELAGRAGSPIRDLGMARGSIGFLGVLFVRAPAWTEAAMPQAAQASQWRRARLTGAVVLLMVLGVVALSFIL